MTSLVRSMGREPPKSVGIYSCSAAQLAEISTLTGGAADVASAICSTIDVNAVGTTNAVLQWTVAKVAQQSEDIAEVVNGLNTWFVLSSAYNVFVMQAGFALYAAGVVRAKNVHMILLKNFMDACIATITFYVLGFAFAFGSKPDGTVNGFIGNWDFALSETVQSDPQPFASWFWNWTFAAASCTILSGSIAERATFHSYLMYSFFMTIWVYPVVAHWLWSPSGWLSAYNKDSILGAGAIDFSGSGVVHMVGGFSSIMASIATGPRVGRFDTSLPVTAFKNHSAPLYVLGTFLLWFGWFGFNPGSNMGVSTYTLVSSVTRTAVTTTMSGGAGAISALFTQFYRTRTWDLLSVCTGALAGLVAITAACSVVEPWAALICGAVAGVIYIYGEQLMEKLEIDDPVGAFPVHGLCGAWGVLFPGLLATESYVVNVYNKPAGEGLMGIFYGGKGQFLACQIIAILVIAAWSAFWNGCLFFGLRYLGLLRVPLEIEAQGMDGQAGSTMASGIDPTKLTKFGSQDVGSMSMQRMSSGAVPPSLGHAEVSLVSSPSNGNHSGHVGVASDTGTYISAGGYGIVKSAAPAQVRTVTPSPLSPTTAQLTPISEHTTPSSTIHSLSARA